MYHDASVQDRILKVALTTALLARGCFFLFCISIIYLPSGRTREIARGGRCSAAFMDVAWLINRNITINSPHKNHHASVTSLNIPVFLRGKKPCLREARRQVTRNDILIYQGPSIMSEIYVGEKWPLSQAVIHHTYSLITWSLEYDHRITGPFHRFLSPPTNALAAPWFGMHIEFKTGPCLQVSLSELAPLPMDLFHSK